MQASFNRARLQDFSGGGSAGQAGAWRGVLAAQISHAQGAAKGRGEGCARDVADFLGVSEKWRARGKRFAGQRLQRDAETVRVTPGAHALDDLLPRVASFRVADVRVLETRFVGDMPLVEIVAEPGTPCSRRSAERAL